MGTQIYSPSVRNRGCSLRLANGTWYWEGSVLWDRAHYLQADSVRTELDDNSGRQPFWHQELVLWKTVFPWTGVGGWLQDDSRALYLLCTLLYLRLSGIRWQRLGTPELQDTELVLKRIAWHRGKKPIYLVFVVLSVVVWEPTGDTGGVYFFPDLLGMGPDKNSATSRKILP